MTFQLIRSRLSRIACMNGINACSRPWTRMYLATSANLAILWKRLSSRLTWSFHFIKEYVCFHSSDARVDWYQGRLSSAGRLVDRLLEVHRHLRSIEILHAMSRERERELCLLCFDVHYSVLKVQNRNASREHVIRFSTNALLLTHEISRVSAAVYAHRKDNVGLFGGISFGNIGLLLLGVTCKKTNRSVFISWTKMSGVVISGLQGSRHEICTENKTKLATNSFEF